MERCLYDCLDNERRAALLAKARISDGLNRSAGLADRQRFSAIRAKLTVRQILSLAVSAKHWL